MKNNLLQIGLSPNEADVYLYLLDLGESPSGELIKKTGKHRNIVYEALDSLVRRKLVAESIKKGKKYFKIANPETLIKQAQDKLELTEKLVKQIKSKGEIRSPQINLYEGQDGWQTAYRRAVKELVKKDKVDIYTLGAGADEWVAAMGDYFIEYGKLCEKGILRVHLLAYEWQREEIKTHQQKIIAHGQVKFLPEKYFVPSNTEIFIDRIFIQIYTTPVNLIEIKNKQVADGYLQHFNILWKIAKE